VEIDFESMATALSIDESTILARAEHLEVLQRIERSLQMICAAILDLEVAMHDCSRRQTKTKR